MYTLEALQHKADGRKVAVMNGFRTTEHHARLRGPAGSLHTNGSAADITVAGMTTYAVYCLAQTCGFSGLGPLHPILIALRQPGETHHRHERRLVMGQRHDSVDAPPESGWGIRSRAAPGGCTLRR